VLDSSNSSSSLNMDALRSSKTSLNFFRITQRDYSS
jgi:hypothetical protein